MAFDIDTAVVHSYNALCDSQAGASSLLLHKLAIVLKKQIENLSANVYGHANPFIPNPVTLPLLTYNVPVQMWGARALRVEPFGLNNSAVPLLTTYNAFNETARNVLRQEAPLGINIGEDNTGLLTAAAIGINQ